jgi:hypothetical protein
MTTKEEISQAILLLLSTAWRCENPIEQINNGSCDEFADDVAKLLQHEVKGQWMPEGIPHCAILFDGLWFDAETPYGVLLEDHPFVRRYREDHPFVRRYREGMEAFTPRLRT